MSPTVLDRLTHAARPGSLPQPLTSFIGREHEIAETRRLLTTSRLLTLTGSGGIGKTRLSYEIAAALADDLDGNVLLVELGALTDTAQVSGAVAAVLGVREEAGRPLLASLVDALRARNALLVLDNCEHLIEACAVLADALLRACPELQILATSRQPLGIAGETVFRVPSLAVGVLPTAATMRTYGEDEIGGATARSSPSIERFEVSTPSEAVRLFAERAQAIVPTFTLTDGNVTAVEQICQRLDGIPLAIELAAGRIMVLSPAQIAARLGDRFGLLSGGSRTALPRYQTLRALIDWSHDLLDERERMLFRRLAVFAGSWTLEAAECVCAVDGLESSEILDLLSGLVAKSLVLTVELSGDVRYRFLETLRAYATEKMHDAGEEPILRERHRVWFRDLAELADSEMLGPRQVVWLQRLDDEHDNFRAALAWSAESVDAEDGLRLVVALYRFWDVRGFVGEGRRWLTEMLARSDAPAPSVSTACIRVRALQAAGRLAVNSGDHDAAHLLLTEAHAIAHGQNDRPGLAAGAYGLGYLARVGGDYAAARVQYEDALRLFRDLGDAHGIAETLVSVGVVAFFQEDLEAAHAFYEESLAAYRALGDRQGMAKSLNNLGEVALEQGDFAEARRLEVECLTLASEIGNRQRVAFALAALGGVAAVQGEPERALRLGAAATSIRAAIGESFSAAWRARFDLWLDPARRALGEEASAAAWAGGHALSMAQAIEYAVRSTDCDEPAVAAGVAPLPDGQLFPLSPREREVAMLVARGMSNRQIAAELVITEDTAANHVRHIRARLELRSRVQIAVWVIERGVPGGLPS